MKRFPFDRLRPKTASITASLHYNPYCDLPPTIWHSISLAIEPLVLGSDAAMPEYETVVDSEISFDGLIIKGRKWDSLDGLYTFEDDQNGSFYVSSAHIPVTVRELSLQYCGKATYQADVTAVFHFEFENAGYADEMARLIFRAFHGGFRFCVPRWSQPNDVRFPVDWGIPSISHDWSADTIREFAQRHFDLTQFDSVTIENGTSLCHPRRCCRRTALDPVGSIDHSGVAPFGEPSTDATGAYNRVPRPDDFHSTVICFKTAHACVLGVLSLLQ